ncbi:GNAT family N-acetyltransferase [Nonomuraea sp. NN258]|uniref:GNAT family N-acetyltransferase n=1 Tax=Nonomuraea antri TaxID=2730852 RepID=UPI0015692472|nr:GNAT family N-acetyltransferase [Nonomuraea antri]NRQ33380.1 GNAT family N-acetyltransferase [Nonomuraea antri]
MSELRTLSAAEIRSERLLLRGAVLDTDRAGLIELGTDPEVRRHLGGPRPLREVEQHVGAVLAAGSTSRPGTYVIADGATNRFLGTLMLAPRWTETSGPVAEDGEELELGYVLRRGAWGAGFAFEAATAALRAAAGELTDRPVVLVTQTANQRSLRLAARLGFRPLRTFEEFGADQTLCTAPLAAFRL